MVKKLEAVKDFGRLA